MEDYNQTGIQKTPKKRRIWIPILIILVFIIMLFILITNCSIKNSVGLGYNCKLDKAIKSQNVKVCDQLSQDYIDSCYKEYAVVSKDASACFGIPDFTKKSICYIELAQGQDNEINLCNSISDESGKESCYYSFVYTKDKIQECDLLTGEDRNSCILSFATIKEDPSICDEIDNNPERKDYCKEILQS